MSQRRTFTNTLFLAAASCLVLSLAACGGGTQPQTHVVGNSGDMTGSQIDNGPSLATLESRYKANSSDQDTAVAYARALREAGRFERARLIVTPFAAKNTKASVPAHVEAASIEAALGNYIKAEDMARKAVLLDPDYGPSYHVLGIALDAQGLHEPAEAAFRKALDHWQGNPSPVLNNLGLNLAASGFIDEALETLRKAQALDPDRIEIERNIRIVSALQNAPVPASALKDSSAHATPTPRRKPSR
jgi:Flp pilus assembly protein TadD